MDSKSTIPSTKATTTPEPAKDKAPILRLPMELRHIIYSYATDHEPWPTLISNERPYSRFATFDEPWPALNPNDRPYSRLATLAPRQRAFLITDRNDLDEPQLICAHQLSLVNKQLRTELCDWLRTASEVPVVTRVTGLDFQHVIHFLSSLGKNQKNAMRVRPDGTFGMSLTIELEGPYTASSMENLQRWIEYVDAFVGLERRAELGTVYKTIDRDGLDHKAFTVIVIRPSQPYDAELSRCIPLTVLENVREYHEGIARGGGEVDLEKILAALYCCWSLDWM